MLDGYKETYDSIVIRGLPATASRPNQAPRRYGDWTA